MRIVEEQQIKLNIVQENNNTKTIDLDEEKVILENENDKIQDDYTDTESDFESDLDDNYSDNFSDEEEICDGLENNLQEINFVESDNEEIVEDNSSVIEEVKDLGDSNNSDNEEESFEKHNLIQKYNDKN